MPLVTTDSLLSSTASTLRSAFDQTSRNVKLAAWNLRLQRQHGKIMHLHTRKNRLRLMFGAYGSGGEWLARNLMLVEKDMPYFNNPLLRIKPNLIEADGRWNLPFDYVKDTEGKHPMETLVGLIASLEDNNLLESASNRIRAKAAAVEQILIQEAHGLLMIEPLVRTFDCPTLLIATDPVYCVDIMLAENSENSANYLRDEFQAIASPAFQMRFLGHSAKAFRRAHQRVCEMPEGRERTLLEQILTLGAINQMFLWMSIKYPKVEALTLRDLILAPNLIYTLGLIGGRKVEHNMVLQPKTDFRPDISSITAGMNGRPHRLSIDEVREGYKLLADASLAEGRPLLSLGEPFGLREQRPRAA
jgi:hypothetical protein